MLRLGFIKKVFGIVSGQLLLTAVVALGISSSRSAQLLLYNSPWIYYGLSLMSMLGLIPLFKLKDRWPHNMIALGLWYALHFCVFRIAPTMRMNTTSRANDPITLSPVPYH